MRTLLALVALAALSPSARAADPKKPPNILLIYTDDQSTRTIDCYPDKWPFARTPQIDRLASAGVRFRGAYLGAWCMPSRASILTGRFPHGVESMRMAGQYPGSEYDPKLCPFWPALFRAAGYNTAQIGKWHTGTDAGFGRDWDYQIVWNRPKLPENAGAYYTTQTLAFNGVEKKTEGYPADNYTKWGVEYIKGANRDKDKPWFLWMCYGSIHGPNTPAPRHKGRYAKAEVDEPSTLFGPWPGKPDYLKDTLAWRRDKDGVVRAGSNGEKVGDEAGGKGTTFADWVRQTNECALAVDEGVGALAEAVKSSGQMANTLIVFTSDQGFAMGEHGMRMKLAPYDANYRSPLIVSMPGTVAIGKKCEHSATAPDLVATFFALAGVKPPQGAHALHGRDLTPLLKNPNAQWPHAALYEHTGQHYGSDVGKLLRDDPKRAIYQKVPWYTAVVQGGWKYVRYLQPGVPEELYDLTIDRHETRNLAGNENHVAQLGALREALLAELERTGAPAEMRPK